MKCLCCGNEIKERVDSFNTNRCCNILWEDKAAIFSRYINGKLYYFKYFYEERSCTIDDKMGNTIMHLPNLSIDFNNLTNFLYNKVGKLLTFI